MRIEEIIWLDAIGDKLASKHAVQTSEVEQILIARPRFRFVQNRKRAGEDIYIALGQTDAGRYLTVLFIYKRAKQALILSARDMAYKERRIYERK